MPKLPQFRSEEDLADFVDSHDIAPYWDEMEPVDPAQFRVERGSRTSVRVPLSRDTLERVKAAAAEKGLRTDAFMGQLISESV